MSNSGEESRKYIEREDTGNYDEQLIGDNKGTDEKILFGASGTKVTSYEGFVGQGYDVINSPYYTSGCVRSAILDTDKMAKDGIIYDDSQGQRKTVTTYEVGKDISSYMENLSASVGVSGKGVFSASLQVDFGISKKVSSEHSFAKCSSYIIKKKQYADMGTVKRVDLRDNYLLPAFKDNLLNPAISPNELFKMYGTHVMLAIYLGGRLDMNYMYNNKSDEDEMSIKTKIEASYAFVSGNTSSSYETKAKSFSENSSYKIITYGGSVGMNMNTLDNASKNMDSWLKSIEETNNLTLVDAGMLNNMAEMFPVWELIDQSILGGKERYDALFLEYNTQLKTADNSIAGMQDKRAEVPYVKNVYIGASGSWDRGISDLRSKSTELITVLNADLNKGAGGAYIVAGYTVTTKKEDKPITNLELYYGKNAPSSYKVGSHTYNLCSGIDLNKGAGGDWIYLFYTTDAGAGGPIKCLYVEIDGDLSGRTGSTGWSRVKDHNGWQDLNKGAGGAFIYLWMQR